MPDGPKTRDNWDKADLIGKLVTGVLLAVITFFVKSTSDKISESLKQQQFTQSLVESVLKHNDTGLNRDLALIVLDDSVPKEKSNLVCRICAQIVRAEVEKAGSADKSNAKMSLASEAFRILQARCADRVGPLIDELLKPEERVVSKADKPEEASFPAQQANFQTQVLAQASSPIVYLQYREDWNGVDKLPDLHKKLKEAGLHSPKGDERIGASVKFKANVRFFYPEDKDNAIKVRDVVKQTFGSEYALTDLSGTKFRPPRGQIEVWCSPQS
jgi:hypothetical protein